MRLRVIPTPLPCHPCPHKAPCCSQGTTLTVAEALGLAETFGDGVVTHLNPRQIQARGWFKGMHPPLEGLWATTVDPHTRRCSLYRNNGCAAHDHRRYPMTCRKYPWEDTHKPSLPQAEDAYLCPEMPNYEPEEYPRCEQCGKLTPHSRATLCSVCLVKSTLKELPKPPPLGPPTANDATVKKP